MPVRLGWDEIRSRAAAFAREWEGETYEKGEAQTFWNQFFRIFGIDRRRVAAFEQRVKQAGLSQASLISFGPASSWSSTRARARTSPEPASRPSITFLA